MISSNLAATTKKSARLSGSRSLRLAQVLQVLVGDLGQRHLGDVQLLALDEVQEKIQRALKDGQGHLIARFTGFDHHTVAGCS